MKTTLEKLEGKIIMAEGLENESFWLMMESARADLAALFQDPAADIGRVRELKAMIIDLLDRRKMLLLGEIALIKGEARLQ